MKKMGKRQSARKAGGVLLDSGDGVIHCQFMKDLFCLAIFVCYLNKSHIVITNKSLTNSF